MEKLRAGAPGRTRRRNAPIAITAVVGVLLAVIAYGRIQTAAAEARDAGATVSTYEGMTRDEIQAALNTQTAESMMTISISSRPTISGDEVAVNVINDEENTFDQRFTLIQEQDGEEVVLYESGVIAPGEAVESCAAAGAQAGEAIVEVQAVEDGEDHGNPTRVEVTLVEADEQ